MIFRVAGIEMSFVRNHQGGMSMFRGDNLAVILAKLGGEFHSDSFIPQLLTGLPGK